MKDAVLTPHGAGRRARLAGILVTICLLLLACGQVISAQDNETRAGSNTPPNMHRVYLPLVMSNYLPPQGRLCRFGIGAPWDVARYPVNQLRIGWYTDWGTRLQPPRPGGVGYLQMVRLTQLQYGVDAYTSDPSGSKLLSVIAANPGSFWVIGNEPDRRAVQDDIEPFVYAHAYHDLYLQIKAADPTATVVAGSIVQPTPLRLQYLDMVLDSYRTRYGGPMPVDVWNIHAFILNEADCVAFPDSCWGAGIPPGINASQGMRFGIEDNDNLDVFKQYVVTFRQWMADRGYQNSGLIITEYGVLMPQDYGFPPSRVNAYMNATFDYLATATGPTGDPADKGRLVQAWAWYSLADRSFNGWLFDPVTLQRTAYGDNFVAYTAGVQPAVNLTPIQLKGEAIAGGGRGLRLTAQIASNGNISAPGAVLMRFYAGDPRQGAPQIGGDQFLPVLDGCGASAEVSVTWQDPPAGTSTVWVRVDPQNAAPESDETDNDLAAQVAGMP
jgi:hypothetical protein